MSAGEWPRPCVCCKAMLRPANTLAKDWPDTMRLMAQGRCSSCYSHRDAMGPCSRRPTPKREGVTPCPGPGCDKMTRPEKRSPEDFPGTVQRVRKGYCYTCANIYAPIVERPEPKVIPLENYPPAMRAMMAQRRARLARKEASKQ